MRQFRGLLILLVFNYLAHAKDHPNNPILTSGYAYLGTFTEVLLEGQDSSNSESNKVLLKLNHSFNPDVNNLDLIYYPIEKLQIGTKFFSRSFKVINQNEKSWTLQSNDNDDYIPGGNACFNIDITITFDYEYQAVGELVVRSYPDCNGYGGLSEAQDSQRNIRSETIRKITFNLKAHKIISENYEEIKAN